MTFRLDYYVAGELASIVRRSGRILGVEIAPDAADEIAGRSRGTPRIANRILRRVRDVAQVRHEGAITVPIAREALDLLEVDEAGLERLDRELLRAIAEKYDGGPVGVSTLAASLGEEPDTIEYVYEPYLLQLGFIQRTPRGRTITKLGRVHLGVAPRRDDQPLLRHRFRDPVTVRVLAWRGVAWRARWRGVAWPSRRSLQIAISGGAPPDTGP